MVDFGLQISIQFDEVVRDFMVNLFKFQYEKAKTIIVNAGRQCKSARRRWLSAALY